MKRKTFLIAAAATLLSSVVSTASAQSIISLSRITTISPSQASVGQTVTVTVTLPENTASYLNYLKSRNEQFKPFPGRAISGVISQNQAVKIFFSAGAGQFIEGTNVTDLGDQRFSVRVPQGAKTGQMKYQRGLASSLSTGTFTLVNTGFAIQNDGQYNVVSLKIDNVERLTAGQVIAPGATLNVGTAAGNRQVQFVFGINASRQIYGVPLGTFTARTSTTNTFPQPLIIGRLLARHFLAAAPLFSINGNFITTSYQALDANLNVYGFDFTMNMTTSAMTFKHWAGGRSNVLNTGTVAEPVSWPNNAAVVTIRFLNNNGSLYGNANLTLSNPGFLPNIIVGDGLIYEMQ